MVLQKLMEHIARIEEARFPDHETHSHSMCSSFEPFRYPEKLACEPSHDFRKTKTCCTGISAAQRFLPCHYFDFVTGSSTGACVQYTSEHDEPLLT